MKLVFYIPISILFSIFPEKICVQRKEKILIWLILYILAQHELNFEKYSPMNKIADVNERKNYQRLERER